MSVLTGEYFVPQIAQITRTEVRKRTRRMNKGWLMMDDYWLLILFTRKTRRGTEVRRRTVLWGNSNCHQLDSNWKKNIFLNCRYIAGNCCSRKRVGGLWSAIAINDQQLKEKIYILMDTDGGPQADEAGEHKLSWMIPAILSKKGSWHVCVTTLYL